MALKIAADTHNLLSETVSILTAVHAGEERATSIYVPPAEARRRMEEDAAKARAAQQAQDRLYADWGWS